jgi:hypothetical protein
MSYFDFPRINFTGNVSINVGTVNNDDYSASPNVTYIASGPGKGEILRLSDTLQVQPVMHDMSEDQFIPWSQAPVATCNAQGVSTGNMIPGEWNYYGDMGVTFEGVNVVGVNLADGTLQTTGNALIGTNVSFNNDSGRSTALICDVNPEDVPSSQIFADVFSLRDSSGNALFQGKPSKAVTRWINFQRNVNLNASAGASGVFQSVIPISDWTDPAVQSVLTNLGMNPNSLPANLQGFVVRYNIYKTIPPIWPWNFTKPDGSLDNDAYLAALVKLYAQPFPANQNPGICQVSGTIGLWYAGEMQSITMGRYLVPPVNNSTFSTGPYTRNNSGGQFNLGPVVAKVYAESLRVTLDLSNAFPELYQNTSGTVTNNKYDINQYNGGGNITFAVQQGAGAVETICELDYTNTTAYQQQGGLVDITVTKAQLTSIQNGNLLVSLNPTNDNDTTLLKEIDYMIASDQACVFGQQGQTAALYQSNSAVPEVCSINVYYRGEPITSSVNLLMQEAITTPNNLDKLTSMQTQLKVTPDNNNKLALTFDTSATGNRLYRIALDVPASANPTPLTPVTNYGGVNVMTDFYVNLRTLPTDDFSTYIDKNGNPTGTPIPWDFLYSNVLQYYALIFPAMVIRLPFVQSVWEDSAANIHARVDASTWESVMYMPRTRDLSDTRRQLIQAWCLQYMPTPPTTSQNSSSSNPA